MPKITSHVGESDRRLTFQIKNTTDKPLIVYGSKIDGKLHPTAYSLDYDQAKGQWFYQTSDGKPLRWKKVSSIFKESQVLRPGEALECDGLAGSAPWMGGGKRTIVTARVSFKEGKEPFEIRSEEFVVK